MANIFKGRGRAVPPVRHALGRTRTPMKGVPCHHHHHDRVDIERGAHRERTAWPSHASRHHRRTGGAVSNPLTDWVEHRSRPSGHVCCAKKEPSPYPNSGDGFLPSGHEMGGTAGIATRPAHPRWAPRSDGGRPHDATGNGEPRTGSNGRACYSGTSREKLQCDKDIAVAIVHFLFVWRCPSVLADDSHPQSGLNPVKLFRAGSATKRTSRPTKSFSYSAKIPGNEPVL